MDRVKLNHEVGSVYTKRVYAGEDFDTVYMGEIIGSVASVLGIFALCFALVLVI
jgi:hypothetical protein